MLQQTLDTYIPDPKLFRKNGKPTALDLFCGCGGFSLGFIRAGWNVICGIDNDFGALSTYWSNLCGLNSIWYNKQEPKRKRKKTREDYGFDFNKPGSGWLSQNPKATPVKAIIQKNIFEIDAEEIFEVIGTYEIDCVIGSPPCQGFSSAGKRQKGDTRDYLLFEYARLVLEINPKTMCMENVPGIKSKKLPDGRKVLDVFLKIIEDRDWDLYYSIKYGADPYSKYVIFENEGIDDLCIKVHDRDALSMILNRR